MLNSSFGIIGRLVDPCDDMDDMDREDDDDDEEDIDDWDQPEGVGKGLVSIVGVFIFVGDSARPPAKHPFIADIT